MDIYLTYLLSSPTSEHYYVGKAKGIKQRWNQHVYDSKKMETFVQKWVSKHKEDAEMVPLEENLTEDEAFFFEEAYIELLKSWGLSVMNATKGGEGISGYKHTDESKKIISETHKGKTYSKESKKKMREAKMEYHPLRGKNMNEEHKLKISLSNTKTYKKIKVYTIYGKYKGEFNSAVEVRNIFLKEHSKANTGDILDICRRGRFKSSHGYIFQFSDDNKIEKLLKDVKTNIKLNKKEVLQYDLEGNFIKKYGSSCEVTKEFKKNNIRVNSVDVRSCCRGKQKTCKGFKWKYGENLFDKEKSNILTSEEIEKRKMLIEKVKND